MLTRGASPRCPPLSRTSPMWTWRHAPCYNACIHIQGTQMWSSSKRVTLTLCEGVLQTARWLHWSTSLMRSWSLHDARWHGLTSGRRWASTHSKSRQQTLKSMQFMYRTRVSTWRCTSYHERDIPCYMMMMRPASVVLMWMRVWIRELSGSPSSRGGVRLGHRPRQRRPRVCI